MRDYGILRSRFWAWAKEKELSIEAQQLAIYCLTSPHTNGTGCFRAPLAYIADDLGTVTDTVRQTLSELSQVGFLRYDERSGWLWVVGFLGHNPIANSNIAKSLISFIDAVPRKLSFYVDFIDSLRSCRIGDGNGSRNPFPNGYLDGLANGMPTHEHEHEHEHEHDIPAPARANKRSTKTTIDADWKPTAELIEYAKAQGSIDPKDTFERFRLHHAGKGTLHKDWTAAAQYWCRNEKNFRRPSGAAESDPWAGVDI